MLRRRSAVRDSLLRDTLAVIMAGGEGSRLGELTRSESKPALPIAGHFRNIDFTLSNCVNSGIRRIGILTQYKAHSLIQHVQRGWNLFRPELGECLELWPAQQRDGANWYQGTADAVRQNIDIIDDHHPQHVLILAGDHIYTMDYLSMLESHIRSKADVTVACVKVPLDEARSFGVLSTNRDGRVVHFQEKPKRPQCSPDHPDCALGSMGIYIFNYQTLRKVLAADARLRNSEHDFGGDILPTLVGDSHVQAYEFLNHETGDPGYWRDVGTLDSYWKANMELLGQPPAIDLYDESWPILAGRYQCAPAKIGASSSVIDSIVGAGCQIEGIVTHSVLSENTRVHDGSVVENSIVLPGAVIGKNCNIQNAIIDSNVCVPDNTVVGDMFCEHGAHTESGIGIRLVTSDSLQAPKPTVAAGLSVA